MRRLRGRKEKIRRIGLFVIIKPKTKDLSVESLKNCDTLIIEGVIDYHGKRKKFSWIIP